MRAAGSIAPVGKGWSYIQNRMLGLQTSAVAIAESQLLSKNDLSVVRHQNSVVLSTITDKVTQWLLVFGLVTRTASVQEFTDMRSSVQVLFVHLQLSLPFVVEE
jgi:hypothetical protein